MCEHPGILSLWVPKGDETRRGQVHMQGWVICRTYIYIYTHGINLLFPPSLPSPSLFEKATSVNREKACNIDMIIGGISILLRNA